MAAGTGEKQLYLDDNVTKLSSGAIVPVDPFTFSNGVMTISAARTPPELLTATGGIAYTSGMINTSGTFDFRYGYFEMRAQLPSGRGLWPAFWTRWADGGMSGEIDAIELLGQTPGLYYGTAHWNDGTGDKSDKTIRQDVGDLTTGFHTYGVNWTDSTITFYLDGVKLGQTATPDAMRVSMYVLANLAVGGIWPGNPDSSTVFPADLKIDWIRVWQSAADLADETHVGTAGSETIPSGDGNDVISAGDGSDTVYAGRGADLLMGEAGNDRLLGGLGDDTMLGGAGADALIGGSGNDTYVIDSADVVTELIGAGFDTVQTGQQAYTLSANLEGLVYTGSAAFRGVGSGAANALIGGDGADTLIGGGGDDTIAGGRGNDTLNGGTGDDRLVAGAGNDTLAGDVGRDTFKIVGQTVTSTATITDFRQGEDVLDFREAGLFSLADVLAHASVSGANMVVRTDGETVTVRNFAPSRLTDADLVLGPLPTHEGPTGLQLSKTVVEENSAAGTEVGVLLGSDTDLTAALDYTLLDSAGGAFAIAGRTLVTAAPLDFEAGATRSVTVRVSDQNGNVIDRTLTVTIADGNDAPELGPQARGQFAENASGVTAASLFAIDPDIGDMTGGAFNGNYQLVAGDNDNALFEVDGVSLRYVGPPLDYDDPAGQRVFAVDVRAVDAAGTSSSPQRVMIDLVNVNEPPGLPPDLSLDMAENQSGVDLVTLFSIDPDAADTVTYELVPGAWSDRFAIVGDVLRYVGAPLDFEDGADPHSMPVSIRARDASGAVSGVQTVVVSLFDVNEAPTLPAHSSAGLSEGRSDIAVIDIAAVDPDAGDSVTYQLVGLDNDNAVFVLDGGTLRYVGPPLDFEDSSAQKQFTVQVQAQDSAGAASQVQTVTVVLQDAAEAPSMATSRVVGLRENATGVQVATLTATDPDASDTTAAGFNGSYEFVAGSNDNALFTLSGGTLTYVGPSVDFEANPRVLTVEVRARDGSGLTSAVQTVFVQPADENEAPQLPAASAAVLPENANGVVVATLAASDPDAGDSVSYRFAEGTNDNALFALSGATLRFVGPALDFETASRRILTVAVEAVDAAGLVSGVQTLTVTLADINEAPASLSLSGQSVPGGSPAGTAVGQISAVDPDAGDSLGFSLTSDAGHLFALQGSTLVTAGMMTPGASYTVGIRATDAGGLSTESTFTITASGQKSVLVQGTASADVMTPATVPPGQPVPGAGADTLLGLAGNDTLDGGAGADSMAGGTGNDVYVVDDIDDVTSELAGAGIDQVNTALAAWTLAANVETLLALGTAGLAGTGNTLSNTITGGTGNDTLDGGAGADRLSGGAGDDTYIVDTASDVVVEGTGGGLDTVRTGLSAWVLGSNLEVLVSTGAGPFSGSGNSLANLLVGSAGNDSLNGGSAADTLQGLGGNDTYTVDQAGDVVLEAEGGGFDRILSSVSYVLPGNVESLALTASGTRATGNALDNVLQGNAGANTLDGGIGADQMSGGDGNDVYLVDHAGDLVLEASGGGNDLVSTILTQYVLAANVERLSFTGLGAFSATGNGIANLITGGSGADRLDGAGGADTLSGGGGNDTYVVDTSADVISEASGAGTDMIQTSLSSWTLGANVETLVFNGGPASGTGNSLANLLAGGAGADTLNGAGGADTLNGGAGADWLAGGTSNDLFVFQRGQAAGDRVTDFSGAGATIGDQLQFVGFGAGTITRVGGTDTYRVTADAAHGGTSEVIVVAGVTNLNTAPGSNDFIFL